jgi:maltose O-acetyltransferase
MKPPILRFLNELGRVLSVRDESSIEPAFVDVFVSKFRSKRHPLQWATSKVVERMRAQWQFRGLGVGSGVTVACPLRVVADGDLEVGNRVRFFGFVLPTVILVNSGGQLSIGDDTWFKCGVSLEASTCVKIGRRCMFASHVHVSDVSGGRTGPVVIEDDVWLSHGAIIEPGITIGRGSVIGAGAVVTSDVPPYSLALGNPARVMSLHLRTGENLRNNGS